MAGACPCWPGSASVETMVPCLRPSGCRHMRSKLHFGVVSEAIVRPTSPRMELGRLRLLRFHPGKPASVGEPGGVRVIRPGSYQVCFGAPGTDEVAGGSIGNAQWSRFGGAAGLPLSTHWNHHSKQRALCLTEFGDALSGVSRSDVCAGGYPLSGREVSIASILNASAFGSGEE